MRTLICPTSILDDARAFAARVPDGAGMFSRACGPTATETIDDGDGGTIVTTTPTGDVTHYLSHYTVPDHYLAAFLPYRSWQQDESGEWQYTQYEGDVPRLLDELGISPAEQAAALGILSQIDISDQSAEAACARLGIVML